MKEMIFNEPEQLLDVFLGLGTTTQTPLDIHSIQEYKAGSSEDE